MKTQVLVSSRSEKSPLNLVKSFAPTARWFAVLPAAICILLAGAVVSRAANGVWNVDTNGNWGTAANWSPAAVPGTAPGDVVGMNLNITSAHTNTLDVPATVGVLNLGDPLPSFFGYTLVGSQTLTFNNNGAGALLAQATPGGAADVIAAPIALADNLTVSNLNTLTLSNLTSGSGKNFTKIGTGTLTLSGSAVSTYTGLTTVGRGTLVEDFTNLATPTDLINNGSALVMAGGTLQIKQKGAATTSQTFNGVTLNADTSSAIIGTQVTSGALLINLGTITQNPGGTVDFTAPTGGAMAASIPAYTNGILGGWATTGNNVSSTSTGDWVSTNSLGRIVAYTAYTTVGAVNVTGVGAASQNWQNPNGGNQTILTASATINSLNQQADFSLSTGVTLTLGSGGLIQHGIARWLKNNGGNAIVNSFTEFLETGLATGELFVHVPSGSETNWRIWPVVADASVPLILIKDGPGEVSLENDQNTYSGGTYVNGGTLGIKAGQAPLTGGELGSGTVTLNSGTLFFQSSGNGTPSFYPPSLVLNGGTVSSIDGFPHLATGGGATITVNAPTTMQRQWGRVTGKYLALDGLLQGSAPLTLQSQGGAANEGAAIWINNPGNTYSGTITVNANTGPGGFAMVDGDNNALQFATVNLVGTRTAGSSDGTLLSGVQFNANVITPVFAALTGSGNIALQDLSAPPLPVALTIGANNGSTTFSGIFSGPGTLTKSGTGRLTLTGVNTYTNTTILSAGVLQLGDGVSTNGSLAGNIDDQTTLVFANSTSQTYARNIFDGGSVIKTGAGTLTLSGANTYTGSTTVSNGAVVLSGSGTSTSVTVAGGTLTLAAAGDVAASAALSVLTNGTMVVTTPQTFTGSVSVNDGGTLAVSASADATYLSPGSLTVGSSTGAKLQFSVVGTVNPLLNPTALIINGTATVNITNSPLTVASYPLIANYPYPDLTKLALGFQPGGRSGQLVLSGGTVYYQVTNAIIDVWTAAASTNWDTTTANWTNASGGNLFALNVPVQFDDSAAGGSSQLVNVTPASLAAGPIVVSNTVDSYVIGGLPLTGQATLTKLGNNTVTLTGTNTFAGATTISNGTVVIGNAGQLGGGNYAASIMDNGVLRYASSAAQTLSGTISGSGALVNTGTGALTLSVSNSYSLGTTNSSGSTIVGSSSSLGTGPITMNGGALGSAATVTLANPILVVANTTNTFGNAAASQMTFAGALTGSGFIQNFPNSSMSTSASFYFTGDASQFTGTVIYTGTSSSGNGIWWRLLNGSGQTYNAQQANFVVLGNNNHNFGFPDNQNSDIIQLGSLSGNGFIQGPFQGGGTNELQVGFLNTSTTFTGSIGINGNNANNFGLTKVGAGILTATGANAYNGPTIVKGGGLVLSTLSTGAGTFSNANNTLLGVVVANTNSLNMASLDLGNNNTNSFANLQTTTPAINIANNGGPLTVNGTVTVNVSGALSGGQTYTLITYGSFAGPGGFVLGTLPPGAAASIANTGSSIVLNVTASSTPELWTGLSSTNWDFTTANNWKSNGIASVYSDNMITLFDDSGAQPNINLAVTLTPGPIIMTNNIAHYSFNSTNGTKLTGGASLTKNGSGTLTLTNLKSDFSGGMVINGGLVEVSSLTNMGAPSGPLQLSAGTLSVLGTFTDTRPWSLGPTSGSGTATLSVAPSRTLFLTNNVINDTIGGSGALVVNGGGTLWVPGFNGYTGGTLVTNATVVGVGFQATSTFGYGTLTLANGTIAGFNTVTVGNPLVITANTTNTLGTTNMGTTTTFTGQVTGSGVITNFPETSVAAGANYFFAGDMSQFTGTIIFNGNNGGAFNTGNGVWWRLGNASFQTVDMSQANLVINGGVNSGRNIGFPDGQNSMLLLLGSLSGTGDFQNSDGTGGGLNFLRVGYLNTSTTFSGRLGRPGATTGLIQLTKVGNGTLTMSGNSNAFSAGIILQGGVLSLGTNDLAATGPLGSTAQSNSISFTGGTLQYSSRNNSDYSPRITNSSSPISIDVNGTNVTFATALSASNIGGLVLTNSTGTGRLTFNANNSYVGDTVINGGALALVSNTGIPSTSANIILGAAGKLDVSAFSFTLPAGKTLSGSGVVTGAVTTASSGALISEGTSGTAGTLTFNNNLNLNNGASVTFKLSTSAVSGNDQIALSNPAGTLSLNLKDTIHISALSGSTPLAAADYLLFSVAGTTAMPTKPILLFDGTAPANANHYAINTSGNNVILKYDTVGAPTVTVSVSPTTAIRGQTVVVSATVVQGDGGPAVSCVADLSAIGGSASAVMNNVGVNQFSLTTTVGVGALPGSEPVLATATDSSPRSGTGVAFLTVTPTTETWDGLAADDNWGSATNWTSDLAPGYVGDNLIFTGSTRTSPNLENDYNVAGLTFDSGASSFTIGSTSGKVLTLAGGVTNTPAVAQIFSLPVVLSGAAIVEDQSSGGITLAGPVSGAGSLTTDFGAGSGGVVILAGANTYAGDTTVNGNMLKLANAAALPSGSGAGNVNILAGTLDLNGNNATVNGLSAASGAVLDNSSASPVTLTAGANNQAGVFAGTINNSGGGILSLLKIGTNNLTLSAANSYAGTTVISNGLVIVGNDGSLGSSGTVTLAGGGIGSTPASNSSTPSNILSNPITVVTGTTNLVGSPAGDSLAFLGALTGSGVIQNFPSTNMSSTPSFYFAGDASGFNGTFIYNSSGTGAQGVWMRFGNYNQVGGTFVGANATFINNAGGALNMGFPDGSQDVTVQMGSFSGNGLFQGPFGNAGTFDHLVVGFLNRNETYSGALGSTVNSVVNFDVQKVGTGTWTLTGASRYTGLTTVSNGALIATTLSTGAGAYTVADGTTLGVQVVNFGSLLMSSLSFGNSTNSILNLSSATTPAITCNGALTLAGTVTVNVNPGIVLITGQQYPLISFASESGSGGFVLGTGLPSGFVANIATNGNTIVLNVTVGATPVVWTGLNNTNWDFTTANNWKSNGISFLYGDGQLSVFDDTAAQTNVNLAVTVAPGAIIVSNNTAHYSFASTNGAKLTGGTSLTKYGAGTLTLTNLSSDFAGGLFINSGTVEASSITNLGSVSNSIVVADTLSVLRSITNLPQALLVGPGVGSGNGTLNVAAGQTLFVSKAIGNNGTGVGTLVKTGSGTLSVSGTNTYTGGTVINGGVFYSTNAANAGNYVYTANNVNYTINNGATLALSFGPAIGNSATLAGGLITGSGNLVKTGPGGIIFGVNGSPEVIALTNGVIDVQQGFLSTDFAQLNFTANMDALNVTNGAYFDLWDQNATVDYISGGGTINKGWSPNATLTIGANNGSSNFVGTIANNLTGLYGSRGGQAGGTLSLVKIGTGTQILSGANTYAGNTTVSNGALIINGSIAAGVTVITNATFAGTGTVNGAVTVNAGGTLGTLTPAGASIGAFTLSGLTLNGNLAVRLNRSLTPAATNDSFTLAGTLTGNGSGTVTMTNLGPALVAGNSFKIFSQAFAAGSSMTVTSTIPPGVGLGWTNKLAVDGTIGVIQTSVTPILQTAPTASPINLGQSLAASVLSGGSVTNAAGANVPGTFAFTTPSTVPPAGTNPQPVTFTPTDLNTYAPFTNNVNVTVLAQVTGLKFIGGLVISGTNLTFSATNTGAGKFYLLTSTNVAAPLRTWTPVWTNVVAGSSSFTTNVGVVDPTLGRQFYILSSTNNN